MKVKYIIEGENAGQGIIESEQLYQPMIGNDIEFPCNELGEPEAEDYMMGRIHKIVHVYDKNTTEAHVTMFLGRYFK